MGRRAGIDQQIAARQPTDYLDRAFARFYRSRWPRQADCCAIHIHAEVAARRAEVKHLGDLQLVAGRPRGILDGYIQRGNGFEIGKADRGSGRGPVIHQQPVHITANQVQVEGGVGGGGTGSNHSRGQSGVINGLIRYQIQLAAYRSAVLQCQHLIGIGFNAQQPAAEKRHRRSGTVLQLLHHRKNSGKGGRSGFHPASALPAAKTFGHKPTHGSTSARRIQNSCAPVYFVSLSYLVISNFLNFANIPVYLKPFSAAFQL